MDTVEILYTNHRGETAIRRIVPVMIRWQSSEWHPEAQWMIEAMDADKGEVRSFAMANIRAWGPVGSLDHMRPKVELQRGISIYNNDIDRLHVRLHKARVGESDEDIQYLLDHIRELETKAVGLMRKYATLLRGPDDTSALLAEARALVACGEAKPGIAVQVAKQHIMCQEPWCCGGHTAAGDICPTCGGTGLAAEYK